MLTDAHCHPFDLNKVFPDAEQERRRLGVLCAASTSSLEEFEYHETLSQKAKEDGAAGLLCCFAIHPQLPAYLYDSKFSSSGEELGKKKNSGIEERLSLLESLAVQGRLAAVGETGFDLYDAKLRETEKIQDEIFAVHAETAIRHDLPLVLHVRKAMHKVFAAEKELKKCRAVIFHSWPGTAGEGESLLKRGINAYFSFGTTIMLNHRQAMHCCSVFPIERLLLETDAPYQPLRGTSRDYSAWEDLPRILDAAAALRKTAGSPGSDAGELEGIVEGNFRRVFNYPALTS